uniref:Calcyphosin n=1 Tax=Hemiscolopendra marginata TaxID=943146 RepID=A0A646QDA1_9MYRI
MFRPQSAQTRNENALRSKSLRQLAVTSDPIERLRLMCLSRGSSGIIGLARVFRRMDDDGSKLLNFEEFSKGIEEFGLRDLNIQEMKDLFNTFDKDGSGSIHYDEFLRTIRPPMTPNRKKLVMEAYAKLDKTGDGQVTIEDLKNVYSVRHHPQFLNGEMTEDQLLTKFLANFEKNSDGIVTTDEFLDYYSGVSASIDTDAYFDLMMRNAWKL